MTEGLINIIFSPKLTENKIPLDKNSWFKNPAQAYSNLYPINKSLHLLRQAFALKYFNFLYGGRLPYYLEDYNLYILKEINKGIKCIDKTEQLIIDRRLYLAKKLYQRAYFIDYVSEEDLLNKITAPNLKNQNVPMVFDYSFIKAIINYLMNYMIIHIGKANDITPISVPNISLYNITIFNKVMYCYKMENITCNYSLNQELIHECSMMNILDKVPLSGFFACLDLSNVSSTDIINYFSSFHSSFEDINNNTKLLYSYLYLIIINKRTELTVSIIKRVLKHFDIVESFIKFISLLVKKCNLTLDKSDLLYKICFKNMNDVDDNDKQKIRSAYNDSIETLNVIKASEAVEDEDATTDLGEDDTSESTENEEDTSDTTEDDTSSDDTTDDSTNESEETKPKIKISLINDKTKKIDIVLSKDDSFNDLIVRDELTVCLTSLIENPTDDMSERDVLFLKELKMRFLHVFSLNTIFNIVSAIAKIPIKLETK